MSEEGPKTRQTTKETLQNLAFAAREVPRDEFGTPLVEISCAASELIATANYSNVTIGPVIVRRWVPDGTDDQLSQHIRDTQALCEAAVAEDRQTVHALIRQSEAGRASS